MDQTRDGILECGAVYTFTDPDQFWNELGELLSVDPEAELDELDYALRSYIAFAAYFMDEYLSEPSSLDSALFALLESPLFTHHPERQSLNIINTITLSATSQQLFISLILIRHLGQADPLAPSSTLLHADATATATADPSAHGRGGVKVFRLMRKRWESVVPVLMKWVWDAGVVADSEEGKIIMPAEGWEERVGTSATSVLYEVCRVQRLNPEELGSFSFEFISHLFSLVERTRDAEDETFNYTLIKLLIALNEQYMVATVAETKGQGQGLPPPILPTILGPHKADRGANLVLEALKESKESKTFGENLIFILNRSNGTPDSLCVSLLILKILYLLFTTSGTAEYFYTNDLCVLVDVFIRELTDLGEESEGLKHTYLRVLHPLLNNTQLRHHPHKRPQLRRVLTSLISHSHYRETDPTTRRLVERNLRGSWCDGMTESLPGEEQRKADRKMTATGELVGSGTGWSSGMGRRRDHPQAGVASPGGIGGVLGSPSSGHGFRGEGNASTLSVDAVAREEGRTGGPKRSASGDSNGGWTALARQTSGSNTPITNSVILERPEPTSDNASTAHYQRFTSKLFPPGDGRHVADPEVDAVGSRLEGLSCSPSSSMVELTGKRRRAPPPPPGSEGGASRPRTPLLGGGSVEGSPRMEGARSPVPGMRRPAPEPPSAFRKKVVAELGPAVAPYARD